MIIGVRKLRADNRYIIFNPAAGTGVSGAVRILTIISFFFVIIFAGCSKSSSDSEKPSFPSYGKGLQEITIFTDYFCPSCQTLDSELDPILNKLMDSGGVKITFVDAPVHKLTQKYAKYFLYAVHAGADFKDILHIRRVLFSIAKSNADLTEEGITSKLREQGIALQPYDLSKVYRAWNEMMKNYDIRSTPTCVVRYSNSDIRKYKGSEEIKRALLLILSTQKSLK